MKFNIIFSFAILIFSVSCKKDAATKNQPSCPIVKISTGTDMNSVFSYDESGRLESINYYGSSITHFSYAGNTIIAISENLVNGNFYRKKTYTIDGNGRVATIKTEYNKTGSDWGLEIYEYNGTQPVKRTLTTSSGNTSVCNYVWKDNNLTEAHYTVQNSSKQLIATQDIMLEYYTDQSYQLGDGRSEDYRVYYGIEIIHPKNLTKKYRSTYTEYTQVDPDLPPMPVSSIETSNYSYGFDSHGKIISVTVTNEDNNQSIITYEYECD